MMTPILLHIGVHKTATTTMQQFFRTQSDILSAHRVEYIPLERMRKHFTPLIVRAALEKEARAALSLALIERTETTLILSDENVSGLAREVLQNQLYHHAEARVRAVIEAATPRPVELFLTIRDPADFLVSLYCEYLRHNPFITFERYTRVIDIEAFSFAETFGWIHALPPEVKVHVLPFERELGGGLERVTTAILRAACGDEAPVDVAELPRARSRAAFTAQEVALFHTIADSAGPRVVKDFINMAERRGHRFGVDRFQPIPETKRKTLAARYRRDLSELAGHGAVVTT